VCVTNDACSKVHANIFGENPITPPVSMRDDGRKESNFCAHGPLTTVIRPDVNVLNSLPAYIDYFISLAE